MRKAIPVGLAMATIIVAGIGYAERGALRDWWADRSAPAVPGAQAYQPVSNDVVVSEGSNGSLEGGIATSKNFILVTNPVTAKVDPLAVQKTLPTEVNLDVPFLSQAPFGDWDYPYQEACEEASVIMVDAFYKGGTGRMDPQRGKIAIDALVDFQTKKFGDYRDTTVAQTAAFASEYFKRPDVRALPLTSLDEVRRIVALGYPVIVPASGKLLANPNFRNGGPPYHMVVIKGYRRDGTMITNDPGTRRGKDYVYDSKVLWNAIHDWNNGNVLEGKKVMLVLLP